MTACKWCGTSFPPMKKKVFCSTDCKSACHAAVKDLGEDMVASGIITISQLRDRHEAKKAAVGPYTG